MDNSSCLLLHLFSLFWISSLSDYFCFLISLTFAPRILLRKKNSSIQQNLEGGSDIDLSVLFKYFSNFLRPTQFNAYLLFQACCYLPLLKIYNFRFCSLILSHFTVLYCLNFFFHVLPLAALSLHTSYMLLNFRLPKCRSLFSYAFLAHIF